MSTIEFWKKSKQSLWMDTQREKAITSDLRAEVRGLKLKLNNSIKREEKLKDEVIAIKKSIPGKIKDRVDEKTELLREKSNKRRKKVSNQEYQLRRFRENSKEHRTFISNMVESLKFLDRDLDWDNTTDRGAILEIIIRAIVTYGKLEKEGYLTFLEFVFLLVGSQRDFFSLDDVKDRAGNLPYQYLKGFNQLIDAGYFEKVNRKKLYYITTAGKERMDAILKHIYTVKIGKYKEVKEFLNR